MNSSEIYGAIEKIAAHTGKLDKERLVKTYIGDEAFRRVLTLAYNPLITFGVAATTLNDIPVHASAGGADFDESTWKLLDALANRDLTGTAAVETIRAQLTGLDPCSQTLLRRILLKDLRAGFGGNTINKAAPGTIPDFPYMRCSLPAKSNIDKWDWAKGVIAQEKADGMFANVNVADNLEVTIVTRQGSEVPLYAVGDELAEAIARYLEPGTQTHGEMLVYKDGVVLPREESNGVMNSLLNGGALEPGLEVRFFAWDQIPLAEVKPKNKYRAPYAVRLTGLAQQLAPAVSSPVQLINSRVVKSRDAAWTFYRDLLRQGKEGVILKSPEAIWQDSTSKDQVKLKLEVPVELRVVGFNEGTGKYAGSLGSLICQSNCGELVVNVNGRTDAMRAQVWADREGWLDAIVTVKANSIMSPEKSDEPHSLFLPVFLERRADKSVADSLVSIREQFAAAAQ